LKKYKSQGNDQIPVELIQAGGEASGADIHKLVRCVWRVGKNCLISRKSLLLYPFSRRVIKLTIVIIVGHHCCQLHTKCYPIALKVKTMKLLGIISVDFDVTDTFFLHSSDTEEKMGV
jgi:hypothetical protein